MRLKLSVLAGVIAVAALVFSAVAIGGGNSSSPMHMHGTMQMQGTQAATTTAGDLRVKLDNLLGQHAVLAMNATDQGVTGAKSFAATANALDRNSVALSRTIGSVYGKKAGNTFLNGKFMWRGHIGFFVDYTKAVAANDKAGKAKAVANLKRYTVVFGDFLANATGLPKLAVRADLVAHVVQLKSQLDAYAAGRFARATSLYSAAYDHMFMTGDLLAGAIAKQYPKKFPTS
jgi:hypothetical protein